MNLASLAKLPDGVEQATQLIGGFDQGLGLGFARLGPAQHEALAGFIAPFAGTPLELPLNDAAAAIKRSEFLVKHFCALAAARTAVQGAQYDALYRQACTATGRTPPATEPGSPKPLSTEGHHTAWLASCQQWLMELALAGFSHLSVEAVPPFSATLAQMQAEPKLARAAALLTGFFVELLQAEQGSVPLFRWADLWARAMMLAQSPPQAETGASISGTFYPLGVDLRSHAHFASASIYGVLESGKQARVVRVPLSSYKVDVLTMSEIWQLFRPDADVLLESLATRKSIEVSNMELLSTGDLRWVGKMKLRSSFDPLEFGAKLASPELAPLPPLPPLTRHPVQLTEMIHLENYSVRESTRSELASLSPGNGAATPLELVIGDAVLPIAPDRLLHDSEIDESAVKQSTAMTGLLRFDRGLWAIQPLTVRTGSGKKQRVVISGESALESCRKDKLKTLETLSERASKLLRKT